MYRTTEDLIAQLQLTEEQRVMLALAGCKFYLAKGQFSDGTHYVTYRPDLTPTLWITTQSGTWNYGRSLAWCLINVINGDWRIEV